MADHFTLTTVLAAGSWGSVTKPIIKEVPEYTKQHLSIARRAIRVSRLVKKYSDDTPKENDEFASFLVEIRTTSSSDLDNIIDQIRTILSLQTSINRAYVADHEETGERARWEGKLTVVTDEIDRRA